MSSGNDESFNDEEYSFDKLSAEDTRLFNALDRNDARAAKAVQRAIRDGANVNAVRADATPLLEACRHGFDEMVGILLDAGADAWWKSAHGHSVISTACHCGHLSTVQLLINHDHGLLEMTNNEGGTPLFYAIRRQSSDIVRFLLDRGANAHHVDQYGKTALMEAYPYDNGSLEIVRLLVAAGVDVEARDEQQQTVLHHAACWAADRYETEVVRELILQHNANMFTSNEDGNTPFDLAYSLEHMADVVDDLIEMYGNKLMQDHGRLALHELLKVAKYSFAEKEDGYLFHPPLNLLQIILPLGYLTLMHLRTLLDVFDPELINRDDSGKLPIHIACQTNAPVEVLALILALDPTTIHIADSTGALPIHLLCGSTAATEYASVRYLVEQGGVGTLATRNQQGLLPLHVLCGSTNPPLRAVEYLIQSFPGSVAVQTDAGQYPFMAAAAADSSSSSLSVVYELVRANPGLVLLR